MTPLAMRVAAQIVTPATKRAFEDRGAVMPLFDQEMHCFDITAIRKSISEAMDQDNLWPDIETIVPRLFLPSPVTWLEYRDDDGDRVAFALVREGSGFRVYLITDNGGLFSMDMCSFFPAPAVLADGRIDVRLSDFVKAGEDAFAVSKPANDGGRRDCLIGAGDRRTLPGKAALARFELGSLERELSTLDRGLKALKAAKTMIGVSVLALDLINTPGLIGLRQHDPHRALARKLAAVGRYPLRSWSEVVLKHQTRLAGETEQTTGAGYHKCLHFVRSHKRHYRDGKVAVIPAHWRGDPALGIKRTRYLVAA